MLSHVISWLMAGRSAVRWLLPAGILLVVIFLYWRHDVMRRRYDVLEAQFQTLNRQVEQVRAGYQHQYHELNRQINRMRAHLVATAENRQAFQSIRETIPDVKTDSASPDLLAVRERLRAALYGTKSP